MVEAPKESDKWFGVGSFKRVFTICACFYLWQNPNLRGAGNEFEEDLRKDSPLLVPFVSFVLSLTLCLATRTCFSVARVSDVMVNEFLLMKSVCFGIPV